MLGLILLVPLASVPAPPSAADPMNATREVGPLSISFAIDQSIEEGLPLPSVGLRLTGVAQRRFGLEASAWTSAFAKLAELSALAVVKLAGDPVLLRAGASYVPSYGSGDHGFSDPATGFHVGASLLSGDVDDSVRFRLDYTYRRFSRPDRGASSLGLGLVMGWTPD